MSEGKDKIHKALVTVYIEKALFDISKPTYEKVVQKLAEEYHCYLTDCYDHPEYLRNVLVDLFGGAGNKIIESITKGLQNFKEYEKISWFLSILNQ